MLEVSVPDLAQSNHEGPDSLIVMAEHDSSGECDGRKEDFRSSIVACCGLPPVL